MSGHGNSEEYRSWRSLDEDQYGNLICPKPTKEYLPSCWRAGEIVNTQCIENTGEPCKEEAQKIREEFANNASSLLRFGLVEDVSEEDWKQCGQLKDSFHPANTYRPNMSAQAA